MSHINFLSNVRFCSELSSGRSLSMVLWQIRCVHYILYPLFVRAVLRCICWLKFCINIAAENILINQNCWSKKMASFKSDSPCSNSGSIFFWHLCVCFLNAHAAFIGVNGHKNKLPQELISLNGCFIILLHLMSHWLPPYFSVIGSVHK